MGRLEPILNRGHQTPEQSGVSLGLVLAATVSLAALVLIAQNLGWLYENTGSQQPGERLLWAPAIVPLVALPIMVYGFGARLFPTLQVLGAGAQPIFSRFRTAVVAFVLAVVGSVLASWIFARLSA